LAVCAFTAAGHDPPTAIAEWAAGCCQLRAPALGIENRERYVRDKTFGEDLQRVRTGNQPCAYAAVCNLVTGAFRRVGYANIAHARRYYGRDERRILALYGYPGNGHQAHQIT
jgi:hypothetical protein